MANRYPSVNIGSGGGSTPGGSGDTAVWGKITGTLQAQADLDAALAAKAPASAADSATWGHIAGSIADQPDLLAFLGGGGVPGLDLVTFQFGCDDPFGPVIAGQRQDYLHTTGDFTVVGFLATVLNPSSSGPVVFDVNINRLSVFNTQKLLIDAGEVSSKTASLVPEGLFINAPVDSEITVDIDAAGVGATGWRVTVFGIRASLGVAPIAPAPGVQPPAFTGGSSVGSVLTATSTGDWSNAPLGYTYEWLRDGEVVDWTSGTHYTLQALDAGRQVGLRVVASNGGGYGAALATPIQVTGTKLPWAPPLKPGISQRLLNVNHLPTPVADAIATQDTATTLTGNVLVNDFDADGDSLTVSKITYAGVDRTMGAAFAATYGTMTVYPNGDWGFSLNLAAKALTTNQTATEVFTYQVSDGQGGNKSTTLTITVNGTNQPPVAVDDFGDVRYNSTLSGNVLANDSDYEGNSLILTKFTIAGSSTEYTPGTASVTLGSAGIIILQANGTWVFTPTSGFSGPAPTIAYTVTDGTSTSTALLTLVVQGAVNTVISDPVTTAQTGLRTFNVGDGQTYTDIDSVPWATMQAGDVVNIFYRATPYLARFGICVKATAAQPFIINGVTDSNGNRPILTGAGARTASGSMLGGGNSVFSAGNETFGVITVKRKPSAPTTDNPSWITIKNLEITGAADNGVAYNRDGSAGNWGFSAGIWLQPCKDVTVQNCLIYGNGLGYFSQAKIGDGPEGTTGESTARPKLLYNRLYNNGAVNKDTYHNVYVQAFNPLIEGNYIGATLAGSGSSYKSRSSADIIRFNYIVCGARALDLVQPYDDNDVVVTDGITKAPDYGIDHVYGNVIVDLARTYRSIHFGGDNGASGEQDPEAAPTPGPASYRKRLFFWNNTYYSAAATSAQHFIFQASWPDTVIECWGNVFGAYSTAGTTMCLLQYCGTLNLRGVNVFHTNTSFADSVAPGDGYVTVNRLGSVINADPLWVAPGSQDFTLGAGSPALDVQSTLPAGLPSTLPTDYPLTYYPRRQLNGLLVRSVVGNTDAGAMERDPSAPPPSAPICTSNPVLNPAGDFVQGGTIQALTGSWIYSPTSYTYQWQHYNTGTASWDNVAGATSNAITLTFNELGDVRCKVGAVNSVDTTYVYSNTRTIVSTPAAAVVQHASGYCIYPGQRQSAVATLASAPTVGNTLVAFISGSDGSTGNLTDNKGNTWVRRGTVNTGYGGYCLDVYTCVVASGKIGAGFAVTATTSFYDKVGVIVHEIAGTFAAVSTTPASESGDAPNKTITQSISASSINQRIVGFLSAGKDWGGDAPVVTSPWLQTERLVKANVIPTATSYVGVSSVTGINTVTATADDGQYFAGWIVTFDRLA